MAKIGLFYDSETGNTEALIERIQANFFSDWELDTHLVWKAKPTTVAEYGAVIFATPTVGCGELPQGWLDLLEQFQHGALSGTTVGLIGLGDQYTYGHEFVNALGELYDAVIQLGARVVGAWPDEGYDYEETTALRNGRWPGVVLDEDNQDELTRPRLERWLSVVKPTLLEAARQRERAEAVGLVKLYQQ